MRKPVGFSNTSNIQGDKLIINNGITASTAFTFTGSNSLTYSLPQEAPLEGQVLTAHSDASLVWATTSNTMGTIVGSGSNYYFAIFNGTSSLTFSVDTDTFIKRIAANQLAIGSNGYQPVQIKWNEVNINPATSSTQIYASSGSLSLSQGTQIDFSTPFIRWTGHSYADGSVFIYDMLNQRIVGTAPSYLQGPTGPTGSTGTQGPQGSTGPTGPMGTFSGGSFMYTAGTINGASFSGTPQTATVYFNGTFTSSYVVNINSEDIRQWTISDKTTTSFVINSNSNVGLTYAVSWNAIETSASLLGAIVGPAGANGTNGATGATGANGTNGNNGATGAQGATGNGLGSQQPLQLADAATVSWNWSNGYNAYVTINGARNIEITGATAGSFGFLKVTQGSTGSYRLNFTASHLFPSSTYSFTPTGGKIDLYSFHFDGTNWLWTYNLNY